MTKDIAMQLAAPFHPSEVKFRYANMKARTGKKLSYIDARTVMERLDEVVGMGNWQSQVTVQCEKTLCALTLKINGEWVTKTDGAGDTQISGEKGGVSDAFKRAAVLFGVGRYLYDGKDPEKVYKDYIKNAGKSVEPETESEGGNQNLEAKDLLEILQGCKDNNDLDQFRMKYGKLSKSLPEKNMLIAEFTRMKAKLK